MLNSIAAIRRSRLHLREAGESYAEHFRFAATVGLLALSAGLACLIHAFVPALCTRTASRTIRLLNRLLDERDQLDEIRSQSIDAMAFTIMVVLAVVLSLPLWWLRIPTPLALGYTLLAFSIPATHLLTNRELAANDAG